MSHSTLTISRSLAAALAIGALAAPAASARPDVAPVAPPYQDLRAPDQLDGTGTHAGPDAPGRDEITHVIPIAHAAPSAARPRSGDGGDGSPTALDLALGAGGIALIGTAAGLGARAATRRRRVPVA